MSLLGIDIGISGCKAVAFSPAGEMLAQAYREYPLYQPQPGWLELNPAEVWAAVKTVICEVTAALAQMAIEPVQALGISTHGESVVPLDEQGRPLCGFITSIDTRASQQAHWWAEQLGRERIFAITGMPLHPMYTVNKLMWLREYDPATFRAAQRFVCMADFIFTRLGLPPTMDYSLAGRTMAFDVSSLTWSAEILALAHLDERQLSRTAPAGTVVGEIAPDVARELGLARGAVAVTGGHDQPSGGLGCGAIAEGIVMDSTGTVECLGVASPKLTLDRSLLDSNLPIAAHTVTGMYFVLGWSSAGGALLRWFRDNFGEAEREEAASTGQSVYDLILAQAAPGPSPVLIQPHFVGSGTPQMDPASKGAILGLDLSTTRAQIIKGILDGVTYEVKLSMDAMEAAGIAVHELRAFGGGSRSKLWLQTKADILGKRVVAMDVTEAPCLGVAIQAGAATGVFPSVTAGVAQMLRPGHPFEPDMTMHARYLERMALFEQIYPALKELNHQM